MPGRSSRRSGYAPSASARREKPPASAIAADRARVLELQREAVALLKRAAQPELSSEEVTRALHDAGRKLEALGAEPDASAASAANAPPAMAPALRTELRRAGRELIGATQRVDVAPVLALLERARAQLEGEVALGLTFQGSYSQTKAPERVYGGHASGMGPAPPAAATPEAGVTSSPVSFEEGPRLPTVTYGGGPTKDHILESGGNGVALLDYDGDGRLDIYLVTAARLTPARERIPHRNALYRNLGGWKFEDVSKQAGVDAAAWGNGVCAGDVDDDGRLDLYVTNWGPNFLFRNRGTGTFEEVAASSDVAAGGWSTGCAFFDADADGDLDLYVARYVATTWDEVVRAQRTLVWRNGPRIMVGPAGLPGEADLFFENLGNGRFSEAADAHGLGDASTGVRVRGGGHRL